jgi:predicted enzyme involved in methoxymalonyl-ACP biosynthesis
MDIETLKDLLRRNDPGFWNALKQETRSVRAFEELFLLSSLCKKALARQCRRLCGIYLPTLKNDTVRDFFRRMGFALISELDTRREFELRLEEFRLILPKTELTHRAYEPG